MHEFGLGLDALAGFSLRQLNESAMMVRMVMPSPPDERSSRTVAAIYDLLVQFNRWPSFSELDKHLDRQGEPDAASILKGISSDLVRGALFMQPQDAISLTVAGLASLPKAAEDLEVFLRVMRFAAHLEQEQLVGAKQPQVTLGGVIAKVELPASGRDDLLKRVYHILNAETWGWSTSGGGDTDWSFEISPLVRPLRDVISIDEYWQRMHPIPTPVSTSAGMPTQGHPVDSLARESIFVVYGRNRVARESMFTFLRALGLKPLEWSQAIHHTGKAAPFNGEILEAAFAQAWAVVVLLTPEEKATLLPQYSEQGDADGDRGGLQARPNVLFEAGMAFGSHPERTIIVELGIVRPLSDIAGRHIVRLADDAPSRKRLAQRLLTAGCAVDQTGDDWLTAGDFTPPVWQGSE